MFLAGDDKQARERVTSLIKGAGFTPVDMGTLEVPGLPSDLPLMYPPSLPPPSGRPHHRRHPCVSLPPVASSLPPAPHHLRAPLHTVLRQVPGSPVPSSLQLPSLPPALPTSRPPSSSPPSRPPSSPPPQICWPLTWSDTFLWELWHHIPMDNMNKTLAIHSLLTLSLCYLPGVLAAWLQLGRGTKYSRFPRWLDSWMRMRKQLVNIWQCQASLQPAARDSSCCSPPPSTHSSPWPTCRRGTRISSSVR